MSAQQLYSTPNHHLALLLHEPPCNIPYAASYMYRCQPTRRLGKLTAPDYARRQVILMPPQ
eukprot:7239580-Pyramimonas_sp.AAC.2